MRRELFSSCLLTWLPTETEQLIPPLQGLHLATFYLLLNPLVKVILVCKTRLACSMEKNAYTTVQIKFATRSLMPLSVVNFNIFSFLNSYDTYSLMPVLRKTPLPKLLARLLQKLA